MKCRSPRRRRSLPTSIAHRYEPVPIRIEKDGRWALADKPPVATSAADVIEQSRVEAARQIRTGREVHLVARPSEETILSIKRAPEASPGTDRSVGDGPPPRRDLSGAPRAVRRRRHHPGTARAGQRAVHRRRRRRVGARHGQGADEGALLGAGSAGLRLPRRPAARLGAAARRDRRRARTPAALSRCSSSQPTWARAWASRRPRTAPACARRWISPDRSTARSSSRRRCPTRARSSARVLGNDDPQTSVPGRSHPRARVLRLRGEVPRRGLEDDHSGRPAADGG